MDHERLAWKSALSVPDALAGVECIPEKPTVWGSFWAPVATGVQELDPDGTSAEAEYDWEGQWIWVHDYCSVDSNDVTLCPDETLNGMGSKSMWPEITGTMKKLKKDATL